MSLILEALKRSEAERRLGEAPDLLAPSPAFIAAAPERTPPMALVAGLIALALLAAGFGGWWLSVRVPNPATRAVAATPAVASPDTPTSRAVRAPPASSNIPALLGLPVTPASRRLSTAQPAPPIASPNIAPDPTAPLLPPETVAGNSPVPLEPQPKPANEGSREDPSLQPPGSAAMVAPQQLPPASDSAAAMPQPTIAPEFIAPPAPEIVEESPASDLPDLSALPLAVRQSLPPLVLNMHLYRATPGERVVILDGKRLREGESAGELQVAEIRSDGVVLVAKGQRFLLSRLPR
ncbi:MAG: general secretion pathway protein GspB [Lysobacterales bacterium]